MADTNKLSEQEIKQTLSDNYKNFDIKIFDVLPSTNDFAKELVNSNNFTHGTAIVANSQTNGRGRFARNFFSPADTGIYFSAILKKSLPIQDISLITIISAVAVCQAIKKLTNLEPKIKWINDIYLNNKKICGILVENVSDLTNLKSKGIVVGIGINLSTKNFPKDIENKAGSVMYNGLSRNKLIATIINNLFDLSKDIYNINIIKEYKSLSLVLNKKITYTKNNKVYSATAIDINDTGNLIVRDDNNNITILECEQVSTTIYNS
ncbi:MAG: biotin--[acetyl-CoA-carboxylase] ligase [Endomicrobiaceae bacterium]|nr:biotin--[acetyl-CoA-carboxylase] ligase [Endomicrobiaceae bacterium]